MESRSSRFPSRRNLACTSFKLGAMAILVSLGAQTIPAQANISRISGLNPVASGAGGTVAASSANAFSASENAALLASPSFRRLQLSYGWVFLFPYLTPISNVVVENNTVSDKNRSAAVDLGYRATQGQALGFRYQLFPDIMNTSLGVSTFFPWSALAYFDTGETFVPEYIMDRSRTQRPELQLGVGLEPWTHFYAGAGIKVAYSLTAKANVFLQTNPIKPSSMRFAASLQPYPVPAFSLGYAPDEGFCAGCTFGVVANFPADHATVMDLTASSRVFGDTAALSFQMLGLSSMYFDPWTFQLGVGIPHFKYGRLKAEASFERWSTFKAPTIMIGNTSTSVCENGTFCPLQISPSQGIGTAFQDIWSFRLGEEWALPESGAYRWILRAGAAYRPSILKQTAASTGNYNFLDPSRWMYTLGVGISKSPWSFDLFLAYHQLETQTVTKASSTDIGAPGYTAGGYFLGGGGALSVEL